VNQSITVSRPSPAAFNAFLVCLIEVARIAFLARLPDGALVQNIPDDAFYYLQAARNFCRLGRWTFDGVAPSSGFHLLWGYVLAALFRVHIGASLHVLFLVGSILQSLGLALAAFFLTKTAERFAGPGAWGGVLLVFLSGISLLQGTWMMESSFAILSGAVIFYFIARVDLQVTAAILMSVLFLGILASLARSDSGLLALWLLIGHVFLWKFGISNRKMMLAASTLLLGTLLGVGMVLFHTHLVSGQWSQASAQEKFFWSTVTGRSLTQPVHIFLLFFNPLINSIWAKRHPSGIGYLRLLELALTAAGLVMMIRTRRRPETLAFALVSLLTILSYCFFYRYDSAAVQPWYVGNFQAPAALLTGIGLAWFFQRYPCAMTSALAMICLCSITCSFRASFPWQETMWRAGIFLHSHQDMRPVGSWNSGIMGYFADDGVVNMDGLMNDTVLSYTKRGDLATYFSQRKIRYIFESPQIWDADMAKRGGYGDGILQHCIRRSEDPFPDDRYNFFAGSHIRIYEVNVDCLSRRNQPS